MIQSRLAQADYPNLDLADVGKYANIGYGTVPGVRAHAIVSGATALLTANLTATAMSFDVEDATRFPAAPFTVQISYERMRVTNVTGGTLTVTRAYDSTTAAAHKKNKTVYEVLTEYVYLVAEEPVKAINGVFIDGRKQGEGFTAYTGQGGDEHTDWAGKAVVAFTTDAILARQRGLSAGDAAARETGEEITATAELASHDELADGSASSYMTVSATGSQEAVVGFAAGNGTVKRQVYSASLENAGVSEAKVIVMVMDVASGAAVVRREIFIPATTSVNIEITQTGGNWRTRFAIKAVKDDVKVYSMGKTVTRMAMPDTGDSLVTHRASGLVLSDAQASDGISSYVTLKPTTKVAAWSAYASTSLGDIDSQIHYATITNPSVSVAAVVKLVSADADGTGRKITRHTIAASSTETISHTHDAGGWDTITRVIIETGEARVEELYKDVLYTTEDILSEKSLEATGSARVVIGADITVDADWTLDDGAGTYTGAPNALIERPDHVLEHFIVARMGFVAGDIDSTSFTAAGASYAAAITGGYKLGFILDGRKRPSEIIRRLAFECRSTIRYAAGKWYLDFLPDAAPAAVATITKDELAGKGAMFRFDSSPLDQLANAINGRYARRYTPGENESEWAGAIKKTDATSLAKYGVYELDVDFTAVRDSSMASDVLDHMILQRKVPLLTVEFPVFWEHFDLEPGDTIDIDNPLYDGRKFYIERIKRTGRDRAIIKAVEWWT